MIARTLRLVRFEWQKLIARRLALVAIALVALAAVASPLAGHLVDAALAPAGKGVSSDPFQNAWTTLASGVRSSLFFAVVIVLVFAGSSVSEEAQLGTLKALFVRPVRRVELLLAKWIALSVFAVVLVLVMTSAAALVGGFQFGFKDVADPATEYVSQLRTRGAMIGWSIQALLLVIPSLVAVVSFGLLFSTAIDHPGYAVGTAIATFLMLGIAAGLSKGAAQALFPHYVGLSLDLLNDIAEQISDATKLLREQTLATAVVPSLSALVFFLGAAWLLETREVAD